MPTLNEEKKLWKKGFKRVACLDEVGRGCVAGPVVAAAVTIVDELRSSSPFTAARVIKKSPFQKLWESDFHNIKDSKKLTPKKREEFYKILTQHPAIEWGTGRVSEKVIDKINILEATKLAMTKAVQQLKKKQDFLVLDGNFKINSKIPQKSIVKADEKVFSCAAASIIAKVTRDRIMKKFHKKYPQYCFNQHKGYPTKLHRKMLKKHGPCQIHRFTFARVN